MLRPGLDAFNACSACHGNARPRGGSFHASEVIGAHLKPSSFGTTGGTSFDSETKTCVSCHDGTIAKDAGGHNLGSELSIRGTADHPMGTPYRSKPASAESDEIRLVPMGALDRRVRLFNKSVGCGSCHSVYSGRENLLVKSNVRSALCLSCHIE
ncbi:MAG: hypothetical protein JSR77_05405 [Planctomycetes bacterium]|nr:hypothetical protein [Planctomycetota bacterium]